MTNSSIALGALVLASALTAVSAQAGVVTVLPGDVTNVAGNNKWVRTNTAGGATANVTGTYLPGPGHTGSIQFNSNASAGKIDLQYTWDITTAAANGYTLGNLTSLGYDWLRAGGTSTAHFVPSMRLFYDLDGNASTTRDQGLLIWEPIYNATAVTNGVWTSSDILGGKFWEITTDPHSNAFLAGLGANQTNQVNLYNYTLADWADPSKSKNEGAGNGGTIGDTLNANTVIYGFNVGIGSGWGGSFSGAVDNIRWGFNGVTTTSNFELVAPAAVPEPGSLALLGLGLAGLAVIRKRKQA